MMKSVITKSGLYPTFHRFVYANGWTAAGAFAVVAVLALPVLLYPSLALMAVAFCFAAISAWTFVLERMMLALRETPDEEPRLTVEEQFNQIDRD